MIYHVGFDLSCILNAPMDEAGAMLKDARTGRSLPGAEAKTHAAIMKAKGFKVLPPCDHHDAEGYCLGHEKDIETVSVPGDGAQKGRG